MGIDKEVKVSVFAVKSILSAHNKFDFPENDISMISLTK
jgi:hypothetical protein